MTHTQKVKPKVVLSYLICKGGNMKRYDAIYFLACKWVWSPLLPTPPDHFGW